MSLMQIIVLALVQGITEFLPISSSAHLILVPIVSNWQDQGQVFAEVRVDGDEMEAFKEALLRAGNDSMNTETTAHIRSYVRAMALCDPGFWGPIWHGLDECKDDYTFMQACYALAEHMWT